MRRSHIAWAVGLLVLVLVGAPTWEPLFGQGPSAAVGEDGSCRGRRGASLTYRESGAADTS